MNQNDLLIQSVEGIVDSYSLEQLIEAERNGWDGKLWSLFAECGFPWVSIPEAYGGSGGGIAEAASILYTCGKYAISLPVAETMLAGRLLAESGSTISSGPMTVVQSPHHLELMKSGDKWVLRGAARGVPWARRGERIVAICTSGGSEFVVDLPVDDLAIEPAVNVAGEPRDSFEVNVRLDGSRVQPVSSSMGLQDLALADALNRAILMSGALVRTLDLAVSYAASREQFGRPIAKFQAIQHKLVAVARETSVACLAVQQAVQSAYDSSEDRAIGIATAKAVTSSAAGTVSAAAHQIHGAIGMTREYPLSHFTRRLLAWRDECGSENSWYSSIGELVAATSRDRLWSLVTDI